jgi:hypothetical protein
MDPQEIESLFRGAGILSFIVCFGFSAVVYIPAIIQYLLTKTGLFLCYHPPEHFIERFLQRELPIDPNNAEAKNFYGYYSQDYFVKYPKNSCKHYLTNNFIVLFIIGIQVVLLMCMGVFLAVGLGLSPSAMAGSALFPTLFAIFHFSDFIKGYFAYVWFIWSNKLRLGDEIDIDNYRGDLVELGPVTSYIYVYMRGVPLIGSVEGPAATATAPNPLHTTLDKEGDVVQPVNSIQRPLIERIAPQLATKDGINVTQIIHHNQLHQVVPVVNKPYSLRGFGPLRPPTPKVPQLAKHSLEPSKLQMHQIGYVALPIEEHFRYQVNTVNLLQNNFRNYSYCSPDPPLAVPPASSSSQFYGKF